MATRCLIKDGVVVNVVVVDAATPVLTRAQHETLVAQEDQAHAEAVERWRGRISNPSGPFKNVSAVRPKLQRTRRWVPPDGFTLGPEGGDIGDAWDGRQYIKPERAENADAD
jgi:hypothetical protein